MSGVRVLFGTLFAVALLAFPAGASAEPVTLGKQPVTPMGGSGAGCFGSCSNVVYVALSDDAPGALTAAPRAGTVTGWRVIDNFGGGSGQYRLRVLRPNGSGAFTSVGRSEPASIVNGSAVNPTALPLQAGDRIGVEILGTTPEAFFGAGRSDSGGSFGHFASLPDGATATPVVAPGVLNLNAVLDLVPAPPAPPPPPAPPKEAVKPRISLLTLSPSAFEAANTGPSLIAAVVGTQVVYELSEAATLKLTVERAAKGQRRKGKCRKPKRGASGRKCTRYVAVKGSASHAGDAGLNKLRFMGRLRGKQLKPGKYRLVTVATDAAGNRSKAKRKSFRILP